MLQSPRDLPKTFPQTSSAVAFMRQARNYEVVNAEMQGERPSNRLNHGVRGLQRRVLELEEKISRFRVRESTLQKEIEALHSEKKQGQAFRGAMQQA